MDHLRVRQGTEGFQTVSIIEKLDAHFDSRMLRPFANDLVSFTGSDLELKCVGSIAAVLPSTQGVWPAHIAQAQLRAVDLYFHNSHCVANVQANGANKEGAPVPIHEPNHHLGWVIEVRRDVHRRGSISENEFCLLALLNNLVSEKDDGYSRRDSGGPPTQRSEPALDIAVLVSAKIPRRPGRQFRQKAHDQNKHCERQCGQHRHTKSLVAHSDTPFASLQLTHDSVRAFNAAWAGGAA